MSEGAAKKGFGEKRQPKEERRKFQAIKGTRDLLPPETALWNHVEQTAREVFGTFGYGEIRLPILEVTELFARAVGGETDIVSKEMYSVESPLATLQTYVSDLASATPSVFQQPAYGILLHKICLEIVGAFEAGDIPNTHKNVAIISDIRNQILIHDEFSQFRTVVPLMRDSICGIEMEHSVLRPEATASVCRAYIENGMQQWPQPVKLYTIGPMFRRERPQKGRYRQFYQIDAEVLEKEVASGEWRVASDEEKQIPRYARNDRAGAERGVASKELAKDAAIDAEVIEMVMTFFERLGLEGVELEINCIGDKKCRPKYVELLRAELRKVKDKLGPDSQRRIETNPLRVLDSKLENEQKLIEGMPHIAEHLCEECAENYRGVKKELELRGVKYRENWRLVRGLDYYSRTTFEITAKGLGSQNAVCGGGRYDGLVELLGGPPTKGIGFAIGEDRLILSLQEQAKSKEVASGGIGANEPEKSRFLAPLGMTMLREVASGGIGANEPEKSRFLAPLGMTMLRGAASGTTPRDVYIAWMGEQARATAIRAAKNLRSAGFRVELPPVEQKFGKALGQADKLGAKYALILGDNEVASGEWTLKTLATGEQTKLTEGKLLEFLKK